MEVTMRRNAYLIIIVFFLILGFSLGEYFENSMAIEADLVETPSNMKDLATMTPVVIKGEMIGVKEIVNIDDVKFVHSEIMVLEVYRDINKNLEIGNTIILTQTEKLEKLPDKGEKIVLFLKNNSEENLNYYRCIGLYKGKFELNKDIIKNSNFDESKNSNIEFSKKELELILDSNPFDVKLYSKKTEEELIKEEKEHEEKIKNDVIYQEFLEKNN